LTWLASAGAARYEVQLDTVNPPVVTVASLTATSYRPTMTLLANTLYTWRVRAIDAAGNISAWSTPRSFTTAGTDVPTRNRFATSTPTLTWNPVSGATGYEIQVDNQAAFTSPEYQNNALLAGDRQVTTAPLPDGLYYWRVRAKRADGTWGAWSAVDTIVVDA
jgi:hypothetical protein